MTTITLVSRLATKRSVLVLSVLATAVAATAAYLISLVTVPLVGNLAGPRTLLTVMATTGPVAFPICLFLIGAISRLKEQRRDLHAREELLTTAQRIAKLSYWHYDLKTSHFTLSDNVHDLLGDPGRTLNMTVPVLLEMTHPEDREKLQAALERIIHHCGCEQIEYRITGLDGVEKTFWVDGQRIVGASGRPIRAYGACQDITDQKAMQKALRESEDQYRNAVELNPQIPWTADPEGNILDIGPRWLAALGMQPEEGLNTGWMAALHPDDVAPTLQCWSCSLASGEPYDIEYRLRLADGSYRWFRARASARRNCEGGIVRWYGTAEDIHDRKEADMALRESEAFARSILESSPDSVKVLDLDGRLQFMSAPGLALKEIEDFSHVKGRNWPEQWPEQSRSQFNEALATARTGRTARFTGFCPTVKGRPMWWDVSVSPIVGPDGKPARLLATSRDVTVAKMAQDELERTREASQDAAQRLGSVLASTTDSVVMLDRDWRLTFLNPGAERMIARGRDLLGVNIADAFPRGARAVFASHFKRALERQEAIQFEEYYPPFGLWIEAHAYPSREGLSIFFRDVTERHQAQEEIQRRMEEAKAASRAKSAFLATMSHEIRTPIHGVLGLAEQLSITRMDPEQKNMLDDLQASGSALLTIINDVLDYSKVEAGKIAVEKESANLAAVVKALEPTFHPLAEARGVSFSIRIGEGLSDWHRTDAGRLRQIMTNLIGNAIKFTEQGAVSVELTCGPVKDGQQAVTFAVTDTGIGIAPAELGRIFDPFEQADVSTTRRFGGTGLGLAISKRLTQAIGGDLTVESAADHGSTFTLSLDLDVVPESQVAVEPEAAAAALPDVTGVRILVAEDNRVNRTILVGLLNRAGCITTFVETGAAAVHCAELQDFDIVLMDISMPEMDGYEATQSIRAREAEKGAPMLPILALTAHVEKNCREQCLASGMQGMLSKPFRSAEILQAIAAHAGSGGEDWTNAGPGDRRVRIPAISRAAFDCAFSETH